MLLSVLGRARIKAQAIQCMSSNRQLMLAWQMYADDFQEIFPPNEDIRDGTSWVYGIMDYSGSPDDTDLQYLINPRYAKLAPYTKSPGIYKCPADRSLNRGLTGRPRVRSVSMNAAIGPDRNNQPNRPGVDWLPSGTYIIYVKETEMIKPAPSDIWVFVDENPDSINDGAFALRMPSSPGSTAWHDYPSIVHDNAAGFAFADGHALIHKWLQPDKMAPVTYIRLKSVDAGPNNPDVIWLAKHTSGRIDRQALPY